MKKLPAFLAALLLLIPNFCVEASALSIDELTAESAVLMDLETGQVLFDKNMEQLAYPASTTKIMTGLLAVEECFPGEILTVTETAVDIDEPESSNIALTPGEELPLEEAMYALMLPSANDSANVIAEHVAGSQDAFAAQMTAKARAIGAMNTNFSNAHGLHEDDHYTTAYDLALITRYAAGDLMFMRYFGTGLHTMPPTNKQELERPFTNYQYMLVKGTRFYNENVIGGKVGYTTPAKHTMSTVAKKDGRTLICVVMGCTRDGKFTDTQALLDFGFGEFSRITIPVEQLEQYIVPLVEDGEQVGDVSLRANSDASFLLHESVEPSKVHFAADLPETYQADEKINAAISLVADAEDEYIPSLLATKALVANISMNAIPTSAPVEGDKAANTALHPWIIIAISAVFMLIAVISLSKYGKYKKRKARLARLNRRMRRESPPATTGARPRSSYSGAGK